MTQRELYIALLRPCVMHILRAAGFQAARPAALDSLVDMAARYLELIAGKTAELAYLNHNGALPGVVDARMALQHVGLLKPELNPTDEQLYGDDDMRGIDGLIAWFQGPAAREIRRIAGLEQEGTNNMVVGNGTAVGPGTTVVSTAGGVNINVNANVNVELDGGKAEDYLTILKKKHSKTGDEARFQGTMLGRDLDAKPIVIEGGTFTSIKAWEAGARGDTIMEESSGEAGG